MKNLKFALVIALGTITFFSTTATAQVSKPGAPTNAVTTIMWNADSNKVNCSVTFITLGGAGQRPTNISVGVYQAWVGAQNDTTVAFTTTASQAMVANHNTVNILEIIEPQLFVGSGQLFAFKVFVANDSGYVEKIIYARSPANTSVGIQEQKIEATRILEIQNPIGSQCNFFTNVLFDQILIIDLSGKVIQVQNSSIPAIDGAYKISTENISKGIYILSLSNKEIPLVTRRILKE